MSEQSLIEITPEPRTQSSLADDLRRLGLQQSNVVIVHSSMRSIGWISGGPVAVVQAMLEVLGDDGTLIMPTHSGENTDPANWGHPPVPKEWHQTIRDTMPAFDPAISPTRDMGAVVECFRSWPGVLRSAHPTSSFAAKGKFAEFVTTGHQLANSLGETSPLARIYELDGQVLLLGVGYDRNTSFHLAEYRVESRTPIACGSAVNLDGNRAWVSYDDIEFGDERFAEIGEEFDAAGSVQFGKIGSADARLFPQRAAVDFAQQWINRRQEATS